MPIDLGDYGMEDDYFESTFANSLHKLLKTEPISLSNWYCPRCAKGLQHRVNLRNNSKFIGCDFPTCRFSCDETTLRSRALSRGELKWLANTTKPIDVVRRIEMAESIHRRSLTKAQQYLSKEQLSTASYEPTDKDQEMAMLRRQVKELESENKRLQGQLNKIVGEMKARTPVDL